MNQNKTCNTSIKMLCRYLRLPLWGPELLFSGVHQGGLLRLFSHQVRGH